jgi:hypothetical protein
MKNRRLTIFCVAVIAIAGAPRVWQEAGKLLALVQHKAQVKFWSMVLQPKTRESAGTALIASAQPFETSPANFNSVCPLHDVESLGAQVWSRSKQTRKVNSASVESKARAQQPAALEPLSHAGLIAKALKAPRGDSRTESLRHSRSTFELQPSEIAEIRAEALARHCVTVAPYPPSIKADTFKFIVLPSVTPVASTPKEKEAIMQFKLLKKTSEEPKLIRQKTRIPVSRGAVAFFPAT